QLTEINLPRIKNYHLDIIENDDGSINFIRKLQPGSTDKSYGIHIAKLAGIPDDVIIRAFLPSIRVIFRELLERYFDRH
ncbi:unnamed protein product, partial [marine sediment metagenome]